jgi:O-antigen/teichoic acid export membrane protein
LAIFQAKIRYDQVLISDTFGAVANLIFVYLAVVNFSSILFVIGALAIGNSIRSVVALYLARFQLGTLEISFNKTFWKKIIVPAIPIGLLAVFSQFNAQIDKQIVFLAHYKPGLDLTGQTAAGIYGLAYKVFEFGVAIPAFIMNVGYPIMVQKREESLDRLLTFSKRLGIVLLLIGFLGLVSGWIASPWIFTIPGLEKFSQSVPSLRILLVGLPLFFVTPLSLWLAISLRKEREMMFIYGFSAVFNFVTNLVFVPSFGYNAAAVITIVSEGLILLLSIGVLYLSVKNKNG